MSQAPTQIEQFEQRKQDHIKFALLNETEAIGFSELDKVKLPHEALPDLNFDELSLKAKQLEQEVQTPFLISSMTAGHTDAKLINQRLMEAADSCGWAMGVGSQRRELDDDNARIEWAGIRQKYPHLRLFGNIGISQLIQSPLSDIQRLIDNIEANAIQIHLNPLQECLQPEGTPSFKGGLNAIEKLAKDIDIPVIIKETGCGFHQQTLLRLNDTGIKACDISGFGGTHWGRIEGKRATDSMQQNASETFRHWGVSTLQSMQNAKAVAPHYEIWASGGVRSGLDAAKLLALGANTIGIAKPLLKAALQGTNEIIKVMKRFEYELKVALFCTGSPSIKHLQAIEYDIT